MNLIPRGCTGIGGELASCMEECRNRTLRLAASYGYNPFNPSEFQLLEGTTSSLSRKRRERLVALNSPFGEPCCLRADITLSAISYLYTHYAPSEFPLRLSYAERVFATPRPPKENLEETQVGVELLGWEDEGADVEVVTLLFRALDALGLGESVVVLGDASIVPRLFASLNGLSEKRSDLLVEALQDGAYYDYKQIVDSAGGMSDAERNILRELPSLKGGAEILLRAGELFAAGGAEELLNPLGVLISSLSALGYGERTRVDLGFIRDLGYYSGPVFNAYADASGTALGGGGRYDWKLSEMGNPAQAVGFGLNLRELALACKPVKRPIHALIWSGSLPADRALSYANELIERGLNCELSWKLEAVDSLALAQRRECSWWINLESGRAFDMESDSAIPAEELLRRGGESC